MVNPSIQFPLSLRPVVRSRERGVAAGASTPYHPAIWIIDSTGRRVMDIASDPDDVRAGRVLRDPHQLVSRASQTVAWLQAMHDRLRAWTEPLECPPDLNVRPIVAVEPSGTHVEVGVQFCSAPDDEFDRITQRLEILAGEQEQARILEPLRDRMFRRHEAAVSIMTTLQEAVDSWRSTEALTATDQPPLVIDDGALEH
jgi:hypothetical protein